jgi:hypothetical protein
MAETNDTTSKAAKAKKAGFDAEGKAYPGVHPETGERVTVTLGALKKEFGAKKGEEMYRSIAGVTQTVGMFDSLEQYAPDIQIAGMSPEIQFKVNEILTGKE